VALLLFFELMVKVDRVVKSLDRSMVQIRGHEPETNLEKSGSNPLAKLYS
jgi:hypothetical protein